MEARVSQARMRPTAATTVLLPVPVNDRFHPSDQALGSRLGGESGRAPAGRTREAFIRDRRDVVLGLAGAGPYPENNRRNSDPGW